MESRRVTSSCSKCDYSTKRTYNLKRHILNEHTVERNSVVPIKTSDGMNQTSEDSHSPQSRMSGSGIPLSEE